ncbi:GPI mannosyltransferase [Aphelenchoides avenae]|nr:GPI mannosyltransferase [Aphelenchus avenae]
MAPFTKVEESFNVQAIHDLLYVRTNFSQYDHHEFPGVVPRTFVGPISLSLLLYPLLPVFHWLEVQKYWMLFAARFILGGFVVISFCNFARRVEKHFGVQTGNFLRLITVSQFHFLFYASRTLPNTFALVLVLWVFALWLDGKHEKAVKVATTATFIFRFELAVTVPIDSLMWKRLVWPEGEVIWFNVILNRSHEYGALPFLWYFTSAVPRAVLVSLPVSVLGCILDRRLVQYVVPILAFLVTYSFLPHKELRFIIYAFPIINLPAAAFCARVWINRRKSLVRRAVAFGAALHIAANLLLSAMFLYASARNYPGGDALSHLQFMHRYLRNKPISVHIDTYCAETGVNRFLHLYDAWEYNKTENLPQEAFGRFDYVLVGSNTENVRDIVGRNFSTTHKEHFSVEAFQRIAYKKSSRFPYLWPVIKFRQKVIALKRLE